MDLGLKGKITVVTGSTGGIGYASAKRFLEEGARVVLNGRNGVKLGNVCKELAGEYGDKSIAGFQGDMTEQEDIARLGAFIRETFGHIDCLVVNVGSGKPVRSNPLDIEEWLEIFKINLFSAVQLMDALDGLWEQSGSVVMVSSIAGRDVLSAPPAYAAAKDGIRVFAKYLADRYAPRGIRVNTVSPGNVLFKGGRWEELLGKDERGVKAYISEKVPMRRFAGPEEIADAIAFLSSERASFITGSNLTIDGGQKRGI